MSFFCRAGLLLVLCAAVGCGVLSRPARAADAPPARTSEAAAITPEARIAAVQARLDALRPRLEALDKPQPDASIAAGMTDAEWSEQRRLLHAMNIYLGSELDALRKIKDVRKALQDAKVANESWRQFDQAPSNALDFVDDLWTRARAKRRQIEAARVEQGMIKGTAEDARAAVEATRSSLRRAIERLETAAGGAQVVRARWLRDMEELRATAAESWLSVVATQQALKEETVAWHGSELDLLQRMATVAAKAFPFSVEERDRRLSALTAHARTLDRDIERALGVESAARSQLETARSALEAARKVSPPEIASMKAAERIFGTRKTMADIAAANLNLLQVFRQTVPLQQQVVRERYDLQHDTDPGRMRAAMEDIDRNLQRLSHWGRYVESELHGLRTPAEALAAELSNPTAMQADNPLLEEKRRAYAEREGMLRRTAAGVESIEALLLNWRDTLTLKRTGATASERAMAYAASAKALAGKLWDLELLTVEDKIVVDGREIAGKRSVTIGKVVEVVLILVVGLWITARIAARGRRIALQRLAGRESTALLVHRVLGLVLSVALIVFALVTANIPLAAFAFLGGALAIAVGFGAQNLLNNFISGLILLIEKPIKVGDVVDVDGARGVVTDIGSRCSQVRRPDGVDLLIPNSTFLQQTVTNLTHSDQQSRYSIKVAASYNAPTRRVAELILHAIRERPEVLSEPAPQVVFEDFGENALAFTGYYWLNVERQPKSGSVSSEIRHRIDELFRENGIEMPFPQRDVHIDAAVPLQVEVALRPAARQGERALPHEQTSVIPIDR